MSEINYTPNSHKYKEEQAEKKEVKKIIQGTARTKKKPNSSKIADVFISEDVHNVKNYILMDVLVPAIKDAVADVVINAVNMALFGETKRTTKRTATDRVSYDRFSKPNSSSSRTTTRTRTSYDFGDVVVDTRGEAEEVLEGMDDLLATYGVVTVADMYDLVGVTCNYTDNKYGWKNIRNAEVVRVRDGYMIRMPKAVPID